MKITPHFSLKEFASKDGAPMPSSAMTQIFELAQALEVIREDVGKPININSGYRSPAHNKAVGGAAASQHLLGTAADITVSNLQPTALADIIEKLIASGKIPQGGIGIYKTFVHYDIRGTKARWDFSSK